MFFPLILFDAKIRQMLLPFVADVNATVYDSYNFSSGRWYSTIFCLKADGIALLYILVDVMTNVWQI